MLSRLHIENYVLIDSLDITFPGGLSIITGRTGAGKSILLGALSLVLGGKADAGMIGAHGSGCVVEADFDVRDDSPLKAFFEENDLEWNGGHMTVRRVLHASGRSRCFIDDLPVQQSVLAELSASLVDIHSQHQTRLLSDTAWQLEALDRYAGSAALASEVRLLWKKSGTLRKSLAEIRERKARMAELREFNEARLDRLTRAAIVPGELEELEAEQKRLANAEEIKEGLYTAESLLSPPDGGGVVSMLKEAEKSLQHVSRYVPEAEELSGRLASSRVELDDILSSLSALSDDVEVSPDRLQQVEDRLSTLYSLMKLHQVTDLDGLIAVRDRLAAELSEGEQIDDREQSLVRELESSEKSYADACRRLSQARQAAAGGFAQEVAGQLRFMELEKASFRVEVSPVQGGPSGTDAVRFLFSADGTREAEVARAASGGEMSRLMLSLKAMMARYAEMPTMIFDEIDTGVSGSAADAMGSVICSMGRDMQVIAITHLPQVAAKGNSHYLVTRNENPATGESVTGISEIAGEDRLLELARMLSGSALSEAAVRNAAELLKAQA